MWEMEKMLVISIFSFSHNVFFCIKEKKIDIFAMINLSSSNAFNLVESKILLFWKGLIMKKNSKFISLPNNKQNLIEPWKWNQR